MKHPAYAFVLLLALLLAVPANGSAAATAFGSNLFQGNFARNSESSVFSEGDRVVLRLWGGNIQFDDTLTVGEDGMLNIPELGPVPVAGIAHDKLAETLKSKLAATGHQDTQVYAAPLDSRPISVFVTGGIQKPGRYSGAPSDPILNFLDKGGGIDSLRGSYRDIRLVRDGKEIARVDLYPFAQKGTLPQLRLRDGDTLVVGKRGPCVTASGAVRTASRFEFLPGKSNGAALMELTEPEPGASHATLKGTRKGAPYSTYLPLKELKNMQLEDGDSLHFVADSASNTILISVEGAVRSAAKFPVRRGATLRDVCNYIAVEPGRANIKAIYLKRPSVAAGQKKAIEDSLRRLEESALTAGANSTEESQIRAKEAEMITKFVEKAKAVEPEGIVVLNDDGKTADLTLEDGDVIVIPEKSDVVLVSGEVMVPRALVWNKKKRLNDYVTGAGGYSARADKGNVLILHQNGAVTRNEDDIIPGDRVMFLPSVRSKSMQVIKDISTVLTQIVVSTRMVLGLPSL